MNHIVNAMRAQILSRLEKFGWTFQAVVHDVAIPFVYTIGVSQHKAGAANMPELIMSSTQLHPSQMQDIMHSLATVWRESGQITLGQLPEIEGDRGSYRNLKAVGLDTVKVKDTHTCQVEVIDPAEQYKVVQIMFADKAGRYPDEEGYDFASYPQEALSHL